MKIIIFFKKQLIEEDFIQITISPGAYEMEKLERRIKKDYY